MFYGSASKYGIKTAPLATENHDSNSAKRANFAIFGVSGVSPQVRVFR